MISFNIPPCVGDELTYVKQAMDSHIMPFKTSFSPL